MSRAKLYYFIMHAGSLKCLMGRQALKPLTARPFICGLSYASKVSGGEEVVREVLKSTFSLKRQTPIKFDHELIALEPSLTKAAKYIATGIPNHTTSWHRVPPVAVTSMARSGKTTLLHSLFNKFLDEEKFNPILVDFNGGGNFFPHDGESDYDAFLRWVATSLLFDKKMKLSPHLIARNKTLRNICQHRPSPSCC